MHRYIVTGTPGAGKTALIRAVEQRGHCVVPEAATDVIALDDARGVAEHWRKPDFVKRIHALQVARIVRATAPLQFHDRSPVCTVALARYLGLPEPAIDIAPFEKSVFFVRNLGRIENTAARRINFEDALAFEAVHELVYREFGFDLVEIAPAPVEARADFIESYLRLAGGM